ncbi:hypothetical protein [Bacteroides sp. An19]|uniref:hypothetical protein n=1 Tax=Bacteroides sp. An19 TaxID=1965580 RepID=UPI000B398740|nr:hypothetical protein [Bacteroides sp. An19]OUP37393.1 hypothetical protein B5F25_01000 [Bacteroides sp. An19]
MNADLYKHLFPLVTVGTSNTLTYTKIEFEYNSKTNILIGLCGNNGYGGSIYNYRRVNESHYVTKLSGNGNFGFKYIRDSSKYELYIEGLGSWGECGILMLNGSIKSVTSISEIPSSATDAQAK